MTTAQHAILVIDDEPQLRAVLRSALSAEGFRVTEADTARRGLIEASCHKPDLVILDLGLPDADGRTVVQRIRQWSSMPVLILSARVDEAQKIAALDAGADDYVTKPFTTGELLARVRAALRRSSLAEDPEPVLHFEDVEIDLARRTARGPAGPIHLTPLQFRLLSVLARHRGGVVTQRRLLAEVWGPEHVEDVHYLRVYMKQLRSKLEREPTRPQYLLTEVGVGYRLSS